MAAGAPGNMAGNGPLPFIPLNDLAVVPERIPQGGMADIFKATWTQRNFFGIATAKTPVVLKQLRDDRAKYRNLFIQESEIWWKLPKHANVLGIYGGNMQDSKMRDPTWYRRIEHLHLSKHTHADLKGVNILINKDNVALVSDFGFSFLRKSDLSLLAPIIQAENQEYVGGITVFMPPERLKPYLQKLPYTPTKSGDIYAFAMICIEIWTSQDTFQDRPLEDNLWTDIIENGVRPTHLNTQDPTLNFLHRIPVILQELIDQSWNPRHNERRMRPTIKDFVTTLEHLLEGDYVLVQQLKLSPMVQQDFQHYLMDSPLLAKDLPVIIYMDPINYPRILPRRKSGTKFHIGGN
ncbi:kinase-like protein [Gonapodya prolifera JEL478]|uniref:Kinase-like protein n=1 Tax=Gonapodya prolifera (strain JEL478) TaxID=1344416 RepID=A0A139A4Y3_GONPJ|nr:kinase-like protein [Gonapodya prolifera JEL478]|eukprot:KXS11801.1 kinase-like protein [Gonapodya prolifera JEL478]